MEKVLIADFSSGKDRVTVRGLWQFDRGVKLKVIGINAADVNRVDFAPVIASEAVPVVVVPDEDGTFTVSIPGTATKSPYDVTAYIYVDTAEYGYTVKAVSMPVILRPEAGNPGEEEKPDPFGEVVEKVSGYATAARDSARAAAESEKAASESATQAEKAKEASRESAEKAAESKEAAATSATSAAESESQARESATIARSAADQAAKSATAAAESTTTATQQAANAAQSAANASGSAKSANQSAETAKTAADAAGKSASSAQQASRSAAESASTATAAAQTATTAAGNAAESVTSAAQSAETAGQKATAAETSASNAAESATEASKSATAAGDSASAAKVSEIAAGEAAQQAQEQAEKIKDSAEQIEKNKTDVTSLKEDITSKADKTSLAQTDRKLDALWKLNQGISYQFEEDSTEAYQKTVPTGAKLASVKRIGGKTIVWNQLIKNGEGETEITCTNADDYVSYRADFDIPIVGHKYLVSFECCIERTDISFLLGLGNYFTGGKLNNISNAWTKISRIVTVTGIEIQYEFFYIYFNATPRTMEVGDSVKVRNIEVFDLTKMFGVSNEPGTVEEFEAMFPDDYSYNPGELLSACVSEVVEQGRNLIDARKVVSKKGDVTFENLGNGKIHVYGSTDTRSEIDEIYVDEKDFPVGRYRINNTGNSGISITFVKKNKATGKKTWCNDKFEITDNDTPLYWYAMAVKCTVDIVITPQITRGNVEIPALAYHDPASFAVPEAVRLLPGYGWSAGNVCNYVDFEEKKYHKRVGKCVVTGNEPFYSSTQDYAGTNSGNAWADIKTGQRGINGKQISNQLEHVRACWENDLTTNAFCLNADNQVHIRIINSLIGTTSESSLAEVAAAVKKYCKILYENGTPIVIYFELAKEEIIDISDLIGDTFQEPFEVEAGGTLTFKNSNGDGFQIPVPNTEEYIVKLSEVAET